MTTAFTVGISITLIMCIFYVVTWEILYFGFLPGFIDKYSAYMVEKARPRARVRPLSRRNFSSWKKYKELYENPLFNAAITFIEPLPVGLVITLTSAAVLRKKVPSQPAQSPLPTSY